MWWLALGWTLWLSPVTTAPEGMAIVGPGLLRLAY